MVLPENRVIGFVLLPIRPAELGKTTNTTFTTSNNLRAVARIALLLQGKQQNTTLRQDITPGEISRKCVQGEALFIVVSIAASLMSAWASKRRCPREALYLVVKVVQVVFHVSTLHHSIFRKNLNFLFSWRIEDRKSDAFLLLFPLPSAFFPLEVAWSQS